MCPVHPTRDENCGLYFSTTFEYEAFSGWWMKMPEVKADQVTPPNCFAVQDCRSALALDCFAGKNSTFLGDAFRASVGDEVHYVFVVENNGTTTLSEAAISDDKVSASHSCAVRSPQCLFVLRLSSFKRYTVPNTFGTPRLRGSSTQSVVTSTSQSFDWLR